MTWAQESDIGRIQIELTNYCNAACPQCERFHLKELSEIRPEDRWEGNASFDLSLYNQYNEVKFLFLLPLSFSPQKWQTIPK